MVGPAPVVRLGATDPFMKNYLFLGSAVLFLLAASASLGAAAPGTWTQNCAACHGDDGGGHTKAGRMLGAKDLADAAYQKTFTDDQALAAIKGGFKDASGTDKMKPFGDKLSDDDSKALVAYIRTLAK
jgi:mono/diheme cytochrome c family protein